MLAWDDPNLEHVSIFASFDVSEDLYQALSTSLTEYRDRRRDLHLNVVGQAESGGSAFTSRLWMASHRTPEAMYHNIVDLSLNRHPIRAVTARRRRTLESKAQTIPKILAAVGELPIEFASQCTMLWGFRNESVSAIIQLPLLRVNIPGIPFREISGVRFTPADDSLNWDVIMDLTGGNILHLTHSFPISGRLSPDILESVVEEGRVVKDAFINELEAPGSED